MEENQKKNVTLYFNSALYDKYVEYCKKEGIALSRSIELFMEEKMKRDK